MNDEREKLKAGIIMFFFFALISQSLKMIFVTDWNTPCKSRIFDYGVFMFILILTFLVSSKIKKDDD